MPCVFLSAHCQKLSLVLRSKNAAIYAYTDNSEKTQFSGPFADTFFIRALSKIRNLLISQLQKRRNFSHCFQSGKKNSFRFLPLRVLFPSTLLKIIFTTVKTNFSKHRIVNPQFSNRKKRHLRLLAVLFFPFTHCQKTLSYFFFSSKTPQHLAPCSQSEKTHTFRLLPVRVFSAHC